MTTATTTEEQQDAQLEHANDDNEETAQEANITDKTEDKKDETVNNSVPESKQEQSGTQELKKGGHLSPPEEKWNYKTQEEYMQYLDNIELKFTLLSSQEGSDINRYVYTSKYTTYNMK